MKSSNFYFNSSFILIFLQETSEGGENPLGEVPPIVPAVTGTETPAEAKPKKSRKRKKDDDGQPKEPKPKKPRKKPEKKPKPPKEGDAMETSLKEGENVELPSGENVTNAVVGTEDEGKEAKESIEGSGTEKDTKEKKSKSKSPKTKDGTPKEPKKSTPKKKLPKLVDNLLKLLYIINLLDFFKCLLCTIQLRLNLNAD